MLAFDQARRAALMADLLRIVTRRPADLLPFDVVRRELKLTNFFDRGIRDVPLDRIVGSFGRPTDFNRAFLPRKEALRDNWKRIRALFETPTGFPPVELYQVGEVYFVVDGHHRISVARALNAPGIEARVKEYLTPVPLHADVTLEQVLLEGARADFLAVSGLALEDENDYRLSEPAGYRRLLDHVVTHRYFRNVEQQIALSWEDAVTSWRDSVYRPMVETIRNSGVLQQFPGRTETDLYLFTMDHLHYLRNRFARATPEQAVAEVQARKPFWKNFLRRLISRRIPNRDAN